MKWYKIQNRKQKKYHACVLLKELFTIVLFLAISFTFVAFMAIHLPLQLLVWPPEIYYSSWPPLVILSSFILFILIEMFSWYSHIVSNIKFWLPMGFIAEGAGEWCINVFFSCFSNTELIILGGVVTVGPSKLVEKYNIQTGNCMFLYVSICFTKNSVTAKCIKAIIHRFVYFCFFIFFSINACSFDFPIRSPMFIPIFFRIFVFYGSLLWVSIVLKPWLLLVTYQGERVGREWSWTLCPRTFIHTFSHLSFTARLSLSCAEKMGTIVKPTIGFFQIYQRIIIV